MQCVISRCLAVALASAVLAGSSVAQTLDFQPVGSLTGNVTAAIPAPGDSTRLFVATDVGVIRIVRNGVLEAAAFLNVQTSTSASGENGLLGLAFDPEYQTTGRFYVFLTGQIPGGAADPVQPRVLEFLVSSANPDLADVSTVRPIIEMSASGIHVGGWIGFGPDGYLYIARGDNGNSSNAQNIESPNGKLLRINPFEDDFPLEPNRNYAIPEGNPFAGATPGVDEAVAIGLRNPFRCSFDQPTGDLYIADVGSTSREEVNRVPLGTVWPLNFGWPCREGFLTQSTTGACAGTPAIPFTSPIIDFTRAQNGCIIGGFVYRGCAIPSMRGRYFLGSCSASVMYSFDPASPVSTLTSHGNLATPITSWGQDAFGELYYGSSALRKVIPATITDCNGNGRTDMCDIAGGVSRDINHDGTPDECAGQCPADFDGSGAVVPADIFFFLSAWFAQIGQMGSGLTADADSNGIVNAADIFFFLDAWFRGNGAVCA